LTMRRHLNTGESSAEWEESRRWPLHQPGGNGFWGVEVLRAIATAASTSSSAPGAASFVVDSRHQPWEDPSLGRP
jgi:hypothetical protein